MKTVKIEVTPVRDGERVSGSILVERKKNGTWTREREYTMLSGDPSSKRTLVLEDDQRIMFEGASDKEIVWDKEQNAAVSQPKDPEKRAEMLAAEEKLREQNIREEEARRLEAEEKAKKEAAQAPKTNLGNPVPAQPTAQPASNKSAPSPTAAAPDQKPATMPAKEDEKQPKKIQDAPQTDSGQGQRGTKG